MAKAKEVVKEAQSIDLVGKFRVLTPMIHKKVRFREGDPISVLESEVKDTTLLKHLAPVDDHAKAIFTRLKKKSESIKPIENSRTEKDLADKKDVAGQTDLDKAPGKTEPDKTVPDKTEPENDNESGNESDDQSAGNDVPMTLTGYYNQSTQSLITNIHNQQTS